MRLDNYLSKVLAVSRSEAKKIISRGAISFNGVKTNSKNLKISKQDNVEYNGKKLLFPSNRYILLNKPTGYICSTVDEMLPSALNLINAESLKPLHFAGRLDADTTGMVLVSDDGQWTHRITSPKSKLPKQYLVELESSIDELQIGSLIKGVKLKDSDKLTLPAKVNAISPKCIQLSIVEGRYHQVKRMLAAVGNRVTKLHRRSIGPLALEEALQLGQWRELTEDEIGFFR